MANVSPGARRPVRALRRPASPTCTTSAAETARHLDRGASRSATSSASASSASATTPAGAATDIPVMPKGRYEIMRAYMPKVGGLGLDMMLRTCTVQANLDFAVRSRHGEEVPPVAWRCSRSPRPCSPTRRSSRASRPAGCPPAPRCGPTPIPTAPACWTSCSRTASASSATPTTRSTCRCISSSATAATSTPRAQSFRAFMDGELPELPGERPTLKDWADHLTTVFPEVRLKTYLEMRGADVRPAGPSAPCRPSGPACSTTPRRSAAAWDLARTGRREEREALRRGRRARRPEGAGRRPLAARTWPSDVVAIAADGPEAATRRHATRPASSPPWTRSPTAASPPPTACWRSSTAPGRRRPPRLRRAGLLTERPWSARLDPVIELATGPIDIGHGRTTAQLASAAYSRNMSGKADEHSRNDPRRHRRLDLRAVAGGRLLSGGAAARRSSWTSPRAIFDRHRGQRHLLFQLQAADLRQVARRDAGRLRLRREGLPLLHQPQGAGRRRGEHGASSSTQGLGELGDKLGPILWQFMATKKFDAADFEAFLKLLPEEHGRPAPAPRHRGAPRQLPPPRLREHVPRGTARPSSSPTAPNTRPWPTSPPTSSTPGWRTPRPRWRPAIPPPSSTAGPRSPRAGRRATSRDGLPYADRASHAGAKPRDVFVFMINGAKERAPAAGKALIERL